VVDLEVNNKRLRAEKVELSKRADTYAQVIHELTSELDRLRSPEIHGSVVSLRSTDTRFRS
jgi:hypothetical protein